MRYSLPDDNPHHDKTRSPGGSQASRTRFRTADDAALKAALLDAFQQTTFEQFWLLEFGVSLEKVVPVQNRSFTDIASSAVSWALRRKHLSAQELIAAALRQNPTNPSLLDLQAKWANTQFTYIGSCPYPGMRPFTEEQNDQFFGRSAEIEQLRARVHSLRMVTLIGSSGSGKSSLLQAGLIPAIRRSGWEVRSMRPASQPLANLHAALDTLVQWDPIQLRNAASAPILVVVDQFEELFTQGKKEAEHFHVDLLSLLALENLHIVLAMRADYYDALINTPVWPHAEPGVMTIGQLTPAGLEEAIRLPAAEAGVTVDPALVERLTSETQGQLGALPFLQETLALLWEGLTEPQITLEDYERLAAGSGGAVTGLQVAMAIHADGVYGSFKTDAANVRVAALTADQRQSLARRTFMRLVQFGEGHGDTRRQQSETQLLAAGDDPESIAGVIEVLVDGRLLTSSGAAGDRRYDISHEKLISGWPLLQQWIASLKEAEQARRRLEIKAAEHKRLGPDSGLLDAKELAEAQGYMQNDAGRALGASRDLQRLIAASVQALNPGFNSRGVGTLAGILLSLILWLGVVYLAALRLDVQVRIAIWISIGLAVVAGAVAAWLSARGRPNWLQHATHSLGRSGRGLAVTGSLIGLSLVCYAAIGVPLIRQIQYCQSFPRSLELPSGGITNVALVNDNISIFNADIVRGTLAEQPRIRAWLTTLEDAQECGFFFQRVAFLRSFVSSSGEHGLMAQLEGESDAFLPQVFENNCFKAQELAYQLLYAIDKTSAIAPAPAAAQAKDPGRCEPYLLNNKAVTAILQRDWDTAQSLLEQAVELAPNYDLAYKNLGDVFAQRGEVRASIPYYIKAAELAPADPDYPFAVALRRHMLYLAERNADDFVQAQSYYSKTLALDDKDVRAYSSLANLYIADGANLDAAAGLLVTARSILSSTQRYIPVELVTYKAAVARNFGQLALQRGDYRQAVAEFKLAESFAVLRFSRDVYGGLNTAYTALGEEELACDARRRLADAYSQNDEVTPAWLLDALAACNA